MQTVAKIDTKTAVLTMEIDRLKVITESLGTSITDAIQQEVSVRLSESLSTEVFVSRLSGGEFIILLHDVKGTDSVVTICKQIQQIMKEQFHIFS